MPATPLRAATSCRSASRASTFACMISFSRSSGIVMQLERGRGREGGRERRREGGGRERRREGGGREGEGRREGGRGMKDERTRRGG